ncbi:MAG: 50S ribosomal protein L33 [candidate division KSB1 bacterium]|nr:50S ribosomal protein L33 [candidate division KSB1 bacterium]MDZ7318470.1 50S ribosomal protein L33 [candidate division KSB1 bacterium]
MREIITLECSECKRRNYTTTKNKRKHTGRVEFKKYCRFCNKHTAHKESR